MAMVVVVVLVMVVVMAVALMRGGLAQLRPARRLRERAGGKERQQSGEKNGFGGGHVGFSDDVTIRGGFRIRSDRCMCSN